jgi:O-antigen ligase
MQLSERAQGWARGVIIALVAATLLIGSLLTPPDQFRWQGVKQLLFIALTLLLTVLALGQADPAAAAARWRRLLAGPSLPALLLVGLAGLSWSVSTEKAYSGPEFLRLAGGVALFFAVAAFFRGRARLQLLVDLLVGVVILTCLLGFVNYQAPTTGGAGIIASFGNRQLFAGFLALLAPLMIALSFAELSPSRKIAVQVAAVLSCAGLLLAQTRSAWIGLIVGLSVVAVLAISQKPEREGRRLASRKAVIVPIVVLMAASTGLFLALSNAASQIGERAATLSAPGRDVSFQQRQALWQGALQMVRERPLLGYGIGAYPFVQAERAPIGRPAALVATGGPSLMEMAHNEYLQMAAEIGVPGLLAYLALLGLFLATMVRALGTKAAGLSRMVIIGVTAGVCAQMVDAVSNPAWRYADVSGFFWAVLGLGMAATAAKRSGEAAPARERPRVSMGRLGWQGATGLLVGLIGYQAVAQGPRTLQVPEYIRPRSALLMPPIAVVLPGQSFQYRLLVLYSNGASEEFTGPRAGLSWTVSQRRGGPPTECLQEQGAGTGRFQAMELPGCVGKTYFVRGAFELNSGLSTFPAVAGTGKLKIAVPWGRTSAIARVVQRR